MGESRLTRWGSRLLATRWLVRAPIGLYRLRLGWALGTRLLMLEHRGRSTGLARYVVLEVVDRPSRDSWVVAAGFGEKAQWLRNVRADPRVRVWNGARSAMPGLARELDPQEKHEALASYEAGHPRAWRRLRPVLEDTLGAPISPDAAALPMVVLTTGPAARPAPGGRGPDSGGGVGRS